MTRISPHKSKMFGWTILCFLLSLTTPVTASSSEELNLSSKPLQAVTMQLRWLHQFQFAGYYAAQHKGFYHQRGLDVSIVAGSPTHRPVSEVLAGRAQYGEANSELLYHYLKGEPLIALAAIFQHSPSVLLTRSDSGIKTPQDMVGKRVMMMGGSEDVDFLAMLANEGVDPDSINILPSSYKIQSLIEGETDLFNAYLTNEPYLLQEQGIAWHTIEPVNYGIDFYSDILFTSRDELQHHPERVKAFREATLLGWEYAMANKQEIIDLILAKYGPLKSRAHLQYEAETMDALILPKLIPMGNINPGRFQRMAELMVQFGLIKTDYSLDLFIYDPDPKVERHHFLRALQIGGLLLIIFATIAFVLWRFNKRLSGEVMQRRGTEQRLEESEQHYRGIIENLLDVYYRTDREGTILEASPSIKEVFGYTPDEIVGTDITTYYAPSYSRDDFLKALKENDGQLQNYEIKGIDSNQNEVWVLGNSRYVIKDGAVVGVEGTLRDISKQKQNEQQIRLLSQAVEQSPVSVLITDLNSNIQYVNGSFEETSGYSAAEVIGKNVSMLKSGTTPRSVYSELWQTIRNGQGWQGELENRKKSGELFWEYAHIAPVSDEGGAVHHYLAVKQDITQRKEHEEHILHQAHFDNLTDLPNRFLALDRLNQLLSEAQRKNGRVAVLFLDLDDFKKVNDTLGHDMGDKLLVEAATRLRSVIRSGDTVGRLGGDEFILLLGGLTNATDARPIVDTLLECFRNTFKLDNRELVLTASIGIALYPDDGETPSALLRNADSAMYHAKKQGRNTYSYFTDAMNREVSRRLLLEEQMHGALDRGEFQLRYQPQIEINSRRTIGVEALLRWHNPVLGHVEPDEFIPIAEQTGLIIPIGQFVITEALSKTAHWRERYGPQFTTAVNLSPRQLRDPNLLAYIEKLINQSGLPGCALELEITEGVLMSGHRFVDQTLASLSKLGIGIAMDDFGTGYSSLSYLRNYPFDTLKIDRSFIIDIADDSADRELVNAAIAMGHSLGLKVVAEGVETEQQLQLLAEQGCEIAQGSLFSMAVSDEEISGNSGNNYVI